jgi:hypothetical protein
LPPEVPCNQLQQKVLIKINAVKADFPLERISNKHERVLGELIGLDSAKLSDDQWQQCCSVSGAIFWSAGVGLIRLVD